MGQRARAVAYLGHRRGGYLHCLRDFPAVSYTHLDVYKRQYVDDVHVGAGPAGRVDAPADGLHLGLRRSGGDECGIRTAVRRCGAVDDGRVFSVHHCLLYTSRCV